MMTKLFESTFNNPDHMTFIRQSYYNCLSPIAKLQYVESQSAYAMKHRTYLLHGITNIDIATTNKDSNSNPISIRQWLSNLKDSNNNKLFIDVNIPINNSVEVTILSSNFDIVQQWEKNGIANIARELSPLNYTKAFADTTDISLLLATTEPWALPKPQQINFLVNQKPAWNTDNKTAPKQQPKPPPKPQTDIIPHTKKPTTTQPPKQIMTDDDNQTHTTMTITSEDNLIIQDLQHDFKEHDIKMSIQDTRIASLEQHYRDLLHLDDLSDRILALESGYREQSSNINKVNQELTGISKTTALISTSIQKQQQQLQNQ
jgi:hypothetical protein